MNPALIVKAAKAAVAAARSKKGRVTLIVILIAPTILIIFLLSVMVSIIITPLNLLLGNDEDNYGLRDFKNSEEVLQYSAAGNYGAIRYTREVISQGDKDIVYFNQNEKPWRNMLYGFLLPISVSGCGPTTMAIVISTLTDCALTPAEAADWSYRNGYLDQGYDYMGDAYASTMHTFVPAIASEYGLLCDGISKGDDTEEIIYEALSDGKLVVAIMGEGVFTDEGHFIILTGMTEGNVLITDSASRERTNQPWSISTIISEAKNGAGGGGPFWAIYNAEEEEDEEEDEEDDEEDDAGEDDTKEEDAEEKDTDEDEIEDDEQGGRP